MLTITYSASFFFFLNGDIWLDLCLTCPTASHEETFLFDSKNIKMH